MQEKEDFCGIGVALGEGEEIEVVMTDVKVLLDLNSVLASKKRQVM